MIQNQSGQAPMVACPRRASPLTQAPTLHPLMDTAQDDRSLSTSANDLLHNLEEARRIERLDEPARRTCGAPLGLHVVG